MSIIKDCMIVNLQVGMWLGYRLDKTTTRRVTEEAAAAPDAARVNKHLIPKEALTEVISTGSAARHHFYSNTLPWKDNGDRLLTRKVSLAFIGVHQKLANDFDNAVKEFLDKKYRTAIEQAEFRMGELFDINDYPSPSDLRRKFYINLDIDSVAQAHDLRLNNNEEAMQARVTKAMQGLWEKLATPLQHFADKLSDSDAIFRDTTITNLREVVSMIPQLNFTNDPALEKIAIDIEQQLTRWDPADLRKGEVTRAAVAGQAQEIMAQMQGFMNAFGGAA